MGKLQPFSLCILEVNETYGIRKMHIRLPKYEFSELEDRNCIITLGVRLANKTVAKLGF